MARADFATTVARAEVRDRSSFGSAAEVRRRYATRYVPGQRLYLESEQPRSRASAVVVNDDPANPILERPPGGATLRGEESHPEETLWKATP